MAAFDLPVQRPGMLQVPDMVNQGSRNLMQFMRLQQQRRNEEDRLELDRENSANSLALDKQKAEDLAAFRAGQLAQDELRTTNQANNYQATQNLARDRFDWDKGANDRKLAQNQLLNQAFLNASNTAREGLGEQFQFTDNNMAALQADERFQAMSPEQQQQFLATSRDKFVSDIGLHTGKRKYEQALRQKFANTQGTPEQIETQIQNELTRVFPEQNNQLTRILAANMGVGSRGSQSKIPGLDDVGNIVDEQQFVNGWKERQDVETGDRSWFGKLLDVNDTDLTDRNIATFVSNMKSQGFNAVEALTALEVAADGDAADGSFDAIVAGNVTPDNPVVQSAINARNLKDRASGQTTNSAANFTQFLSSQMNVNLPTTELRRREILLGMLGNKIQKAEADGSINNAPDQETTEIVQELVKQDEQAVANGTPEEQVGGFAKFLGGKQNAQSIQNIADAVGDTAGSAFDSVIDAAGVVSDGLSNTIDNRGLLGLLGSALTNNTTSALTGGMLDLFSGNPETRIQSLQKELAQMNTDNPQGAGARRAKVIQQEIAQLQELLKQQQG